MTISIENELDKIECYDSSRLDQNQKIADCTLANSLVPKNKQLIMQPTL